MSSVLDSFLEIAEDPYTYVADWKERNGRKVVACLPMSLPEELVHAAGMLPVVMWTSGQPITLGQAYAPTHHCGFSRSFVDDMVRGALGFVDGMIFYDTCLVARANVMVAMRHNPPPYLKYIHLPPHKSPAARDFVFETLVDLKASLEDLGGQEITPEALRRSIRIYNENRDLLNKLYQFRREHPRAVRAREMVGIVHASTLMPKEEHSAMLRTLIEELAQQAIPADDRVRLVLSGHFCHPPRVDILDLIEAHGGVIVDDEIFCGTRYFTNNVSEDGEPIAALVDRYMERTPPDPTKSDTEGKWSDWGDYIAAVARRSNAQGVISLMVKFCPPHQEWHPDIRRALADAGIPELLLQAEREAVSLAPIRTRIEAFIETLVGGED